MGNGLTLAHFLTLSALLFVIGMLGVLTRKNILIIFMSVELMLNAVNISLIAFVGLPELDGRAGLRGLRDYPRRRRSGDRSRTDPGPQPHAAIQST